MSGLVAPNLPSSAKSARKTITERRIKQRLMVLIENMLLSLYQRLSDSLFSEPQPQTRQFHHVPGNMLGLKPTPIRKQPIIFGEI
jgi:hypothetical protein